MSCPESSGQAAGSSVALHPTAQVWHLPSPPTCLHTTSIHSSLWGQANPICISSGYLQMCRNATLPYWLCASAFFSLPSKCKSSMDWLTLNNTLNFSPKIFPSFRLDYCTIVPQLLLCSPRLHVSNRKNWQYKWRYLELMCLSILTLQQKCFLEVKKLQFCQLFR